VDLPAIAMVTIQAPKGDWREWFVGVERKDAG
jgi:hypothetical protein